MPSSLTTLLLPGLDGTGRLFGPLLNALPPSLSPKVVSYSSDAVYDYQGLEAFVEHSIPADRPFAIVAESFSGPLALRVAAKAPKELVALILVASFVENPIPFLPSGTRFLIAPLWFRRAPPAFLIRRFLLGSDAPRELVSEVLATWRLIDPAVLAHRVQEVLSVNAVEAYIRCPVPLFYIGGSQDKLVSPNVARKLKALRADLECVTIDAPHLVLQRCPVVAAKHIEEFIVRHDPSRKNLP